MITLQKSPEWTGSRRLSVHLNPGPGLTSILGHLLFISFFLFPFDRLRKETSGLSRQRFTVIEITPSPTHRPSRLTAPKPRTVTQVKPIAEGVTEPMHPQMTNEAFETEDAGGAEHSVLTSQQDNLWELYKADLSAWLNRLKRYPSVAFKEKQVGLAVVEFLIDWEGNFKAPRLIQSSGFELLDKEAVALIERAKKFQLLPSSVKETSVLFRVPIEFKID